MRWTGLPFVAALALTACVTINVYFPAAEAREAAREFVENVIGEDGAAPAPAQPVDQPGGMPGGMALEGAAASGGLAFDPWILLGIAPVHAQTPDITIRTPAIQAIQQRMESRFASTLRPHFDSGALGFGGDGLVVVRDAGSLPLKDRVAVNAAVADDNRDRNAVYREVAVANGHPEWEPQIREVFARQWIASARGGWWYQQGNSWKQK
ncbi:MULTISPECIES: YdbL family protein [unclassified Luteimonas]|uniref:YdbL family protein n=1 Tax=unclassified Luteimonas TaxID=2629088 RepID=UPI0018F0A00D|nr:MULTISPECIES: YdbL family protein [unclassified Luteimonas]MBJ6979559.1 YdbL family protein [Luteimonas sp. MC1895]MBJ6983155.1 YdbL family protein [Luteimonas sp. MC1750]QQO05139.1 YdbL family protein [Luteimonas sp. MC1750]